MCEKFDGYFCKFPAFLLTTQSIQCLALRKINSFTWEMLSATTVLYGCLDTEQLPFSGSVYERLHQLGSVVLRLHIFMFIEASRTNKSFLLSLAASSRGCEGVPRACGSSSNQPGLGVPAAY